tara:strand:+ start:1206 stop:1535 length:330 start_codon:yes stop_codon:yes gene_type:complete
MLLSCNKGCRINGGTTEGQLDLESHDVVCMVCDEILSDISPFCKDIMKSSGDIIRKRNEKAFVFNCLECGKNVETIMNNGIICGKDCSSDSCNIKVTESMKEAIKFLRG